MTRPEQLDSHPLRIGLSMHASVDLHDTSGTWLSQQSPKEPLLDTAVYRDQLAQADALIERILQANGGRAQGSQPAPGRS